MPPRCVVVTDANVLINLMHVTRLELCARLPGHEFVVPDHVREEITDAGQRSTFEQAVARGIFRIEAITGIESVMLFAELTLHLGRGEAACLAIAVERGWSIASDEKRRFLREAESRIGRARILRTHDLYVLALRAGVLTVEEADADKAKLEQRRFRMPFASFHELVGQRDEGKK